jgi:hypothetical protein
MIRSLLSLLAAFVVVSFTATVTADDKKETKIEGKMVCSKCKLKETKECGNVVVVKDGDKEIKYYLNDKGEKETYHVCSGEKSVTVTGKVVEKDSKKTVDEAKVEEKK